MHKKIESDPFNQRMVAENGTRNYCEIFTTKRYPRETNEEISASLTDFLRRSGVI